MLGRTMVIAAVAGIAASVYGASECATNFRGTGSLTETTVEVANRTPEQVINRLAPRLQAGGVAMKSTEPKRGLLDAVGLSVTAEASGRATRVTFHSSTSADQATLCRYAGMLADPPLTSNDVARFREASVSDEEVIRRIIAAIDIRFDLSENGLATLRTRKVSPKVIAAMMQRAGAATLSAANADDQTPASIRADLLARHEIGRDNNRASFRSEADFLEFAILATRPIASNMREYQISMLLPHDNCQIATEDMEDVATGFAGERPGPRTRPVRVEAILHYTSEHGVWKITGADITRLHSIP